MVKLKNGSMVCRQCGKDLDIPRDADVRVRFVSESDGEPPKRLLLVDGKEVHRC